MAMTMARGGCRWGKMAKLGGGHRGDFKCTGHQGTGVDSLTRRALSTEEWTGHCCSVAFLSPSPYSSVWSHSLFCLLFLAHTMLCFLCLCAPQTFLLWCRTFLIDDQNIRETMPCVFAGLGKGGPKCNWQASVINRFHVWCFRNQSAVRTLQLHSSNQWSYKRLWRRALFQLFKMRWIEEKWSVQWKPYLIARPNRLVEIWILLTLN